MALVASSISGAAYVMNNAEDKDTGNGFEFTRRKKWPQLLLQELIGSALFCLKPVPSARGSNDASSSTASQKMTWKMLFVSPSVGDMLGQKPTDIEGRDFMEFVYPGDQNQIHNMFNILLAPHLVHHQSNSSSNSSTNPSTPLMPLSTASKSQTTYVRMITENSPTRPNSSKGSSTATQKSKDESNTVLWEVRAHATGVEGADLPSGFGLGGAGTVVPTSQGENDMRGKAVWLMGRRVGEGLAEGEGNGQNLDAFLELKLENEKLREELRELQVDFDDDDYRLSRQTIDPQPTRQSFPISISPSSDNSASSPSSSTASSPAYSAPPKPAKVGRPPKDKESREKKKQKKSAAAASAGPRASVGGEGEGMHVCVTCGRTDSPEWRKGPLGPKTLCNACGLRWAKRNSTAPTRKDKKATTTTGK